MPPNKKKQPQKNKPTLQMELMTRAYQIQPGTLDEKERSVEAVIATEAPAIVLDRKRFEVIAEVLLMTGCRMPESGQLPLVDTHDHTTVKKQLGSTRNLRIEGDKFIGRNFFSKSKLEEAEHAWELTRGGHLTDNSISYSVISGIRIEPGQTGTVNGRQYTAPMDMALRVETEWVPRSNSVCAMGADDDAKNRNQTHLFQGKDRPMDEFKKWLTERGLVFDELSENQRAA